jgi:hypothetical protein
MRLPRQTKPVRMRVPVGMAGDVGLGDVVKGLTSKLGVAPCGGCEERAAAMNRHLVFTGRPSPRR